MDKVVYTDVDEDGFIVERSHPQEGCELTACWGYREGVDVGRVIRRRDGTSLLREDGTALCSSCLAEADCLGHDTGELLATFRCDDCCPHWEGHCRPVRSCPSCWEGRHGFHDSGCGSPAASCACWCLKRGEGGPSIITVTVAVDVKPLGEGFEAHVPALGASATAETRWQAVAAVQELADEILREQEIAARGGCP